MSKSTLILPTWTFHNQDFHRDLAIHIDDTGRIAQVAQRMSDDRGIELKKHALLPGFVNAHSHAFQRGLRTRGISQRFPSGAGNFWSWRESMYRLADSLDVDSFYEISKLAFEEMLHAGITGVGEFHYLHHAGESKRWALDDAIIAAARDAGIRMVLIQTYYATGAIGKNLAGAQIRFGPGSREEFVRQLDHVAGKLDSETQSLAIACHSIRAASLEDIVFFRDYAAQNDLPFHIHVEEARQEIADSIASYGKRPLATLMDRIKIDERVTAIHCTHSTPADLREFISRGGRVCLCPITEGNLADGFPDMPTIRSAGGKICIGSDSNIRIGMTEELRWMEFGQRLKRESRGVVVDESGNSAAALHQIGTIHGAESLSLSSGEIAVGRCADLIAIDLDHPTMRGVERDAILDNLIFGAGNGAITNVWVNGRRIAQ